MEQNGQILQSRTSIQGSGNMVPRETSLDSFVQEEKHCLEKVFNEASDILEIFNLAEACRDKIGQEGALGSDGGRHRCRPRVPHTLWHLHPTPHPASSLLVMAEASNQVSAPRLVLLDSASPQQPRDSFKTLVRSASKLESPSLGLWGVVCFGPGLS